MYLELLIVVVLFGLSALFSSSESAIFSLKDYDIDSLREQDTFFSRTLLFLYESKDSCLIVILVGNLIVNILISALVTKIALAAFGTVGLVYAVALVTILLLIFGEITPKTFALKNARTFALALAPLIFIFRKMVFPVILILEKASAFFLNLILGAEKTEHLNADELSTALAIGAQEGVFQPMEKKLIDQILDFKEVYAAERMTPRPDVFCVSIESSREEILSSSEHKRYSKVPVYEGEIDHIVGYFQMKDFLLYPEKSLSEIMYPALIVPESKPLDKLLEDMQNKKLKLAVVLDEYANLEGIITMRDILEAIFGDLSSFPQKVKPSIFSMKKGVYRIPGFFSLREVNAYLEKNFFSEEEMEEVDTIAGFFMTLLNGLPKQGDSVQTERFRLSVTKLLKRRVLEVELEIFVSLEEGII
jgi:CBS domain containing-hemolysin-like protein